jgi:TM2 domain-containing membrane protein YozV
MMADKLQQAIAAIKAGDNVTGKTLLIELISDDHRNEQAWLWMTRVVNSIDEKTVCLHNALVINPHNEHARQELARLRASSSSPSVQPESSAPESEQVPAATLQPVSDRGAAQATRQCPYCAETIKAQAKVCRYCGRDLVTGQTASPPTYVQQAPPQVVVQTQSQREWSPGIAAVLSFFIPGLGQIYKAQIARGILVFLMTVGGYALFVVPGIIMHLIAIVDATQGDPYSKTTSRPSGGTNSGSGSGSNNFLIFTLLIVIGIVLVCVLIYAFMPSVG